MDHQHDIVGLGRLFNKRTREMLRLTEKEERSGKANVGAFLNTLTQNLQKIQLSGIPAIAERRETESQIVLTITIPK